MGARPVIYISAVNKELSSARQVVANALEALGYEPEWDEIADNAPRDRRPLFQRRIDRCSGVIQLVGRCYGDEPPLSDRPGGRVSYAQTEAHYARQCGKPVWYFVLEGTFPTDPHPPEPKELRSLQAAYIRRVRGYESEHHVVRDPADLTAWIRELRYELDPLRRGSRFWATGVILFVALSVVASVWLLQHRHTILQHLEQAAPPAIPAEKVDPPQQ